MKESCRRLGGAERQLELEWLRQPSARVLSFCCTLLYI